MKALVAVEAGLLLAPAALIAYRKTKRAERIAGFERWSDELRQWDK
jgi:hypothetical protein